MGNTRKPHTKLSPTLISIVVYMSCLAHFTVVPLQRGFWCTFVVLFHYWSYIAVFLWCYYPDAEIPADIIKVLSKIRLMESSCWKRTFYQRSLNTEHTLNHTVKVANAFFQPFASLTSDCLFWTISRSSLWACGTLFLSRVFRSLCSRCCSCVGITHWMQQTVLEEILTLTLLTSWSIRFVQTSNRIRLWKNFATDGNIWPRSDAKV